MKIECKNQREGGSLIDIGGTEYHFQPLADGAHVADVANEEHVERFLSIPEAYCLYRAGKNEKAVEPKAPVTPANPDGNKTPESDATTDGGQPDIAALRIQYKERFGKNAFNGWSAEQIIEKLAAE